GGSQAREGPRRCGERALRRKGPPAHPPPRRRLLHRARALTEAARRFPSERGRSVSSSTPIHVSGGSSVPAFETPQSLLAAQGQDLGHSEWLEITQERINQFADATGDHQWIHVDVERAKTGPFGAPIAHGFLTLSLTSLFLPELLSVEKASMGVNYGMNRVRFPSPVKVGSRIRGVGKLLAAEEIKGGVQATIEITVEIEGASKPACVVEFLARFYD